MPAGDSTLMQTPFLGLVLSKPADLKPFRIPWWTCLTLGAAPRRLTGDTSTWLGSICKGPLLFRVFVASSFSTFTASFSYLPVSVRSEEISGASNFFDAAMIAGIRHNRKNEESWKQVAGPEAGGRAKTSAMDKKIWKVEWDVWVSIGGESGSGMDVMEWKTMFYMAQCIGPSSSWARPSAS